MIETTINKDTKKPGGLTGFSTKTNEVNRWTINASYRASLYSHLQEFLGVNTKKYVHADLQKSRLRNDQDDITSMLSIIEECFVGPFSENPLLIISNGMLATEKLVLDTFNNFKLGTERMDTFIEERCIEKSKDFFDPLKRINIETFSKLSKCVTYKCKDKDIPLVVKLTVMLHSKRCQKHYYITYLKQAKMHPKLMFIYLIQLKMHSELEDHLGNYSFATLPQHKR